MKGANSIGPIELCAFSALLSPFFPFKRLCKCAKEHAKMETAKCTKVYW